VSAGADHVGPSLFKTKKQRREEKKRVIVGTAGGSKAETTVPRAGEKRNKKLGAVVAQAHI